MNINIRHFNKGERKRIFDRLYKDENITFHFLFVGSDTKDNLNYKQVSRLLNEFFSNLKSFGDLIKNIVYLRTILREYEEKILNIEIFNNDKKMFIKYENKELIKYELEMKNENSFEDNAKVIVKYEFEKGINFYLSDFESNIIEYPHFEQTTKLVVGVMKEVNDLQHIEPLKLNRDIEILCQIYKIFYKENIDLNSRETIIKIQSMVNILNCFGISLFDYKFDVEKDINIPISLELEQTIKELQIFGKIDFSTELDDSLIIYEDIIKIIGEIIKDNSKEIENLMKISTIIYMSKINNPSIQEISELSDYSFTEVDNCMQLVKKIDSRLLDK